MSTFRGFLKELYFSIASRATPLFGNLMVVATKPGESSTRTDPLDVEMSLRCPISGFRLVRDGDAYVAEADGVTYSYPMREGIPTLILEEVELR